MEYFRSLEKYHYKVVIDPITDASVKEYFEKMIKKQTEDNVFPFYTLSDAINHAYQSVEMTRVPISQIVLNHSHNYYEVNYVIRGELIQYINGKVYHLNPGDIIIMATNTQHMTYSSADCVAGNIMLSVKFFDGFEERYKNKLSGTALEDILKGKANFYIFRGGSDTPLFHLLDSVDKFIGHVFEATSIRRAYMYNMVENICFEIILGMQEETLPFLTDRDPLPSVASPEAVLKFINANITNVTAEDIQRHFGFSRMGFYRFMKNATGSSFSVYLGRMRLGHVCRRLTLSDDKIADIAAEVGFENPQYFYHFFKKQMHMTPTEYRKLGGMQKDVLK